MNEFTIKGNRAGTGENVVLALLGGIDILADDGRTLYNLRLLPGGVLEVNAPSMATHAGVLLDTRLAVMPESLGRVSLVRPPYREGGGGS